MAHKALSFFLSQTANMTHATAPQDQNSQSAAADGVHARSLWYFLMEEIATELAKYPEQQKCIRCQSQTRQRVAIRAGTTVLSCEIPVPACRACSRRIPFRTTNVDFRPWLALPLLILLLISVIANVPPAVTFLSGLFFAIPILVPAPRSISIAQRNSHLADLVCRVDLLGYLHHHVPGLRLELPLELHSYVSGKHDPVETFRASLREHQQLQFLISNAELQRSEIDPRLLHMLLDRIRSLASSLLRHADASKAIALRIDCAVLPGRRMEFELAGTPRASDPLRQQLLTELRRTPPIGVRWPVIFSFKLANSIGGSQLDSLDGPFSGWPRNAGHATPAETALQLFRTAPDPEAPVLTLADCFLWQAVAPLEDSLVLDFSDLLLGEKRHAEAVSVLEKAIANAPDSAMLLHKLAWLLGHLTQFERAAAVCLQLMERFPRYPAGWGILASLQLRMNRPEDAEQTLLSAPKQHRTSDFWITSADVAAALQKYDAALAFLNVAILRNLACVPALMRQAELFADTGRFDRALDNVGIVERLRPISPDLISFKARMFVELNRTQDAIATLSHGLAGFPDEILLQFLRADLLLSSGKPAMALEDCRAILLRRPDFTAAHELQALIHLESDEPEAAVTAAEHAMRSDNAGSRAWYARGIARLQMQQVELSIEDLETACGMAPTEIRQRYALARARLASGQREIALSELNTLLSSHPDASDALVFRGFLHISLGDSDLATKDFQLARQLAPRLVSPLYGLAIVSRMAGDFPAALQLLDTALQIEPTDDGCLLERARLLATKDDLQAATRDLDTVLEHDPDSLPALLSRARIRLDLGKLDDARRDFDAILKQEPESMEALIGRSVLSEQSGDADSARDDLQKATEHSPEKSDRIEVARLLIQAAIAHRNEQFEDAVALCSQALEIDPDNYEARLERARAWWYSDCFVEALEDYQVLIDTAALPSAELLCCRGGIYNELGEFDLALEDLEDSRQLAILDSIAILPWTLSSLARTFTALERWTDAEAAFSECLRLQHNSPWFHYYHGLYFVARMDHVMAAQCFQRALSTTRRLPPSKRARAQAFLSRRRE